jgi:HEAT repeat protein
MNARAGNVWNGHPIDMTPPSLETLVEMLREPPSCWIAFAMLGRRDDEASLALLVRETQSADQFRRRSAVEAIGSHLRGHSALDVVRQLLRDPSPFVVRAAISVAQELADAASHDGIVAVLHDSDATTRTSALHALALLWQPDDFEAIFDVAQHDPAKQVRRKASWTLRQRADDATWRRLAGHLIASELPRERAWACELAKQFGSGADIFLAERCENDQDGHVRKAARDAITAFSPRAR